MKSKVRACIIDDEKPARDELRFLIEKNYSQIKIIGEFDNTADATEFLQEESCDLLFLDIEMPEETGVQFAERIDRELEDLPYIIFVTAYDQFAIKAFELDAVDYLLKPIKESRLEQAISKMEERMASKFSEADLETSKLHDILSLLQEKEEKVTHLTFSMGEQLIPVSVSDIIYATVVDKCTYVYTTRGKFQYSGTLTELETELANREFFRSHKSFLLHLSQIEKISIWFNGSYQVKLRECGEPVPVSRKQAKQFKKLLNIK